MITVLLADDHTVLLDGLRYLLEAQKDIMIIGTASNGQEAVDQALMSCPDVVIMDISMPIMNGIEDSAGTELVAAIRALHEGKRYLSRQVAKSLGDSSGWKN
jgi:DNA-binding NarL/FixJ family response regulator